jgi:hypothetical protein
MPLSDLDLWVYRFLNEHQPNTRFHMGDVYRWLMNKPEVAAQLLAMDLRDLGMVLQKYCTSETLGYYSFCPSTLAARLNCAL